MMGLSDGRKSFPIGLAVLIQYRSVTASQPPSHVAVAITLNAKASSLKSKEWQLWFWCFTSAEWAKLCGIFSEWQSLSSWRNWQSYAASCRSGETGLDAVSRWFSWTIKIESHYMCLLNAVFHIPHRYWVTRIYHKQSPVQAPGCKNRPAVFPGQMYAATKPGSVCPLS